MSGIFRVGGIDPASVTGDGVAMDLLAEPEERELIKLSRTGRDGAGRGGGTGAASHHDVSARDGGARASLVPQAPRARRAGRIARALDAGKGDADRAREWAWLLGISAPERM